MKITKRQLKRIIREEFSKLIKESAEDFGQAFDKQYKRADGSYSGHPDEEMHDKPHGGLGSLDLSNSGTINTRGMKADLLDYMDIFDTAVDPYNKREIMIKLADQGFTFNVDTYEDALDDWRSETASIPRRR